MVTWQSAGVGILSFVDEIEQGLFSRGCNNRTVCKGGGAVERYSLLHKELIPLFWLWWEVVPTMMGARHCTSEAQFKSACGRHTICIELVYSALQPLAAFFGRCKSSKFPSKTVMGAEYFCQYCLLCSTWSRGSMWTMWRWHRVYKSVCIRISRIQRQSIH